LEEKSFDDVFINHLEINIASLVYLTSQKDLSNHWSFQMGKIIKTIHLLLIRLIGFRIEGEDHILSDIRPYFSFLDEESMKDEKIDIDMPLCKYIRMFFGIAGKMLE
jgi:hypothetical protein